MINKIIRLFAKVYLKLIDLIEKVILKTGLKLFIALLVGTLLIIGVYGYVTTINHIKQSQLEKVYINSRIERDENRHSTLKIVEVDGKRVIKDNLTLKEFDELNRYTDSEVKRQATLILSVYDKETQKKALSELKLSAKAKKGVLDVNADLHESLDGDFTNALNIQNVFSDYSKKSSKYTYIVRYTRQIINYQNSVISRSVSGYLTLNYNKLTLDSWELIEGV